MKTKIPKKALAVKEPLFIKSIRLARANPSKIGYMILFDGLFFIIFFYILPILNQYVNQNIAAPKTFSSNSIFTVFFLIVMLLKLAYYLMVLFAYSFFKYTVLDYVKSLFIKKEFSFKRLGEFYSLNIIIAGMFFAVMVILEFILAGIKKDYAPFVFIFFAVPYVLLLYVIANASHSQFYEGASIKESIKKGFKTAFSKIRVYRETILIMILAALLLWLLFFGSGYLIRIAASRNYALYLSAYAYFKKASVIVFDAVFYFIILVNRISFYQLAAEGKDK